MRTVELLFEQWLDEIRPVVPLGDEGISNRERYSDIVDTLSIAFEAGFKARYKNDKLGNYMNSFLKGFFSIFSWMSPKSLDSSLNDSDNSMQDLYTKMGWGKYINPSWNTSIDMTRSISTSEWNDYINQNKTVEEVYGNVKIVTQSQFLDEMIKLIPSGCFQPYAYYNEDMDALQVYFKDSSSYTQPLNQNVELHLSHDTDEITGATILNIKNLLH